VVEYVIGIGEGRIPYPGELGGREN
jgi:hypothetical protein